MKEFLDLEALFSDDKSVVDKWEKDAIEKVLVEGRKHPRVEPFIPWLLGTGWVTKPSTNGLFSKRPSSNTMSMGELSYQRQIFIVIRKEIIYRLRKDDLYNSLTAEERSAIKPATLLVLSTGASNDKIREELEEVLFDIALRNRGYVRE